MVLANSTITLARVNDGETGEPGRIYFIELSASTIQRGGEGAYLPSEITASGYYRDGTAEMRMAYAGRWAIDTSEDGIRFTAVYASEQDEAACAYDTSELGANTAAVRFTLLASGGTGTVLDMQTLPVVTGAGSLDAVYQEIDRRYTDATKTAQEIVLSAVKDYVRTSDLETFMEQVSTQFVQSADSIDILFSRLTETIQELEGETVSEFAEWKKYIRFVDGSIVLGEENNPLILTLVNNRIKFTSNGVEVAYFSDNKMYVSNIVATDTADLCGLVITKDSAGNVFIN